MDKHVPIALQHTSFFDEAVSDFLSDEELSEFCFYLAQHPEMGDRIPRGGGVRKIRWGAKGKGKRGGARIIYYYYDDKIPILLLDAYAKSDKVKLSSDDLKILRQLAHAYRDAWSSKEYYED